MVHTTRLTVLSSIAGLTLIAACARESPPEEPVEVLWSADTLTSREIELGRRDSSWRQAVTLDRRFVVKAALDTVAIPESWRDIGTIAEADSVNLPLYGEVEGPSVLYVQVLLDRTRFSPGILDGKWGKNTEKAVYWLQHREGLPANGLVDSLTLARLTELAGAPDSYVRDHQLTEDDVAGPFVAIPRNVYVQKELPCLCHESLVEKLAERFHASPEVLAELNPTVAIDSLQVGDSLRVPNLVWSEPDPEPVTEPEIASLVISGQGYYLHALDGDGRILHHFPTTLGSRYSPSPEGDFEIVTVTPNPWFLYQPKLLTGADPTKPNTLIPPGPNNPVGAVWVKLSKPHFGIHGTSEPATIGYATSSGCVRLTNWDVRFLSERLGPGTPVEFRDTQFEEDVPAAEDSTAGD